MTFSTNSENLLTLKSTLLPSGLLTTSPQPKRFIKLCISSISLICWVIWNLKLTENPVLVFEDFWTTTKKHPSPSVKPANQYGSLIKVFFSKGPGAHKRSLLGLWTGTISGNALSNSEQKVNLYSMLL